MATSYCQFVSKLEATNPHKIYHDQHYGFPVYDDHALFERLVLEINQAGLSWQTILLKQENFRRAFNDFDIKTVAQFGEHDRQRLLADAGIIRNKLKVNAAIENARAIVKIQENFGSFRNWLDHHHPKPLADWVKIFRQHFRFVGGEIVNEMLMSTGYLPGAHSADCEVYAKIIKLNPPFYHT